jgi:biopolymer transport protein ExbB/TolQ
MVARHGALIETIVARAVEDRALNESKFRVIDEKLNTLDAKMDRLLEADRVASGVREQSKQDTRDALEKAEKKAREDRDAAERKADRRSARLATIASIGSGAVVVILTEIVRWWLRKHGV